MMKMREKNNLFLSLAGLLALVLVWAAATLLVGNAYVLPSPWETMAAAVKLLGEGNFYTAFFATLSRAVLAFFIALIFGVGFALAAYLSPVFEKILRPIVAVLRSLPTMAVLLLILTWFTPLLAPVVIGVMTLFPILYTATYSALGSVDKRLVEMSNVYRVPLATQVKKLYLPCVMPKLLLEGFAGLSFALKLIVSAEVLTLTYRSLGGWLQESAIAADRTELMALTLLVCVVGIALESLGAWLAAKGAKVCD